MASTSDPSLPSVVPTSISDEQWSQLAAVIHSHRRFLLTTHVKPDGDGLGSQLGLGRFLRGLGKEVAIVNDTPLNSAYRFLDPDGFIQSYQDAEAALAANPPEVIFILDISSFGRLGALKDYVKSCRAFTVCMDHHQPSGDESSDLNMIDVEAAATGEIVHRLTKLWNAPLTQEIAEPLYASILTDTGCFAHTNASARIHRVAADLLDTGISHTEIYRSLYQQSSLGRYKLLAHLMLGLQTSLEGALSWMKVDMGLLRKYGISSDDINYFSESPRAVEGIEAIILFLELEEGGVKLSFRSKGRANVLQLAKHFGGGGHQHAAGARMGGSMAEAESLVLPTAAKMLGEQLGIDIRLP